MVDLLQVMALIYYYEEPPSAFEEFSNRNWSLHGKIERVARLIG